MSTTNPTGPAKADPGNHPSEQTSDESYNEWATRVAKEEASSSKPSPAPAQHSKP